MNQEEENALLDLATTPVPIKLTEDGRALVGGTRVPLETVVFCFNEGATPEEILQRYPALSLPAIDSLLAFYLNRRTQVDAYLARERELFQEPRQTALAHSNAEGLRTQLISRQRMELAGCLDDEDAEAVRQAVAEECESVDPEGW